MAALKAAKPVDLVATEMVILELNKARALAWTLERLGEEDGTLDLSDAPESTRGWLQWVVADALRATLDEIEREYRKQRTDPPRLSVVDGGGEQGGA